MCAEGISTAGHHTAESDGLRTALLHACQCIKMQQRQDGLPLPYHCRDGLPSAALSPAQTT